MHETEENTKHPAMHNFFELNTTTCYIFYTVGKISLQRITKDFSHWSDAISSPFLLVNY